LAVDGASGELGGIGFLRDGDGVAIRLPSGRRLVYPMARLSCAEERQRLVYSDATGIYGGKIVENIMQAVGRDILRDTILRLEGSGWKVVCHVHDSIICLAPVAKAKDCLATMLAEWRAPVKWLPGLILDAEGGDGRTFADI
jgi:DNA polymerase